MRTAHQTTATGEALRAGAFVTYVRTLQFFGQRLRGDAENRKPVLVPVKEIEERFFRWPDFDRKTELAKLIEAGEIAVHTSATPQGKKLYKYEALKPGGISFDLLKPRGLALDEVTREMLAHLQAVSLPPGAPSTVYFDIFLKMKRTHARLFITVDEFAGRVHTPITNFHKTHRPNILLHDEVTTSLDVTTMQPLLLGKILKAHIGANEFSGWIDSGLDVYTMLQKAANLNTRDEGKKRFFEVLFAPANDSLAAAFGAANWIEWVNAFKRKPLPANPHTLEKNYSNMAWLLQTTEVAAMRKVWAQLIAAKVPFLSVHDEIITQAQHAATAEGIFRGVLDAEFDFYSLNTKGNRAKIEAENTTSFFAEMLKAGTLPPHPVHIATDANGQKWFADNPAEFVKGCLELIETEQNADAITGLEHLYKALTATP